jgi:hypothetical protein
MSMKRTLLLALLQIGVCFASDTWVVRDNGIGSARVGMTLAELKATLHQNLEESESGSDNCFYARSSKYPHLAFMIQDGKLSRVDVDARGIATSTGIQVGDSETRARQIYGSKMKVTEHQYVETGHYLTVRSGLYGIRFETDKGKITEFYAGKYEAIQYVEGCE